MDQEPATGRLVLYGPLAAQDYADNYDHTAHRWGLGQAERYSDFLDRAIADVAKNPNCGKRVEDHPIARAYFVRWPRARYGHLIVYREIDEGVYILRILHSAMDLSSHLPEG